MPKLTGADKIQQFRPICLLKYIYKWLTKSLTIRLEHYADKLINIQQNAFIKKRNIRDGVLTLHEVMHHTHVKREIGVVLKLDFEKAYDKVNREFLLSCLHHKGFNEKLCHWIDQVLRDGTVSVKLNDTVCPYFVSSKGVRQGDPLSPMLFNLEA